MQKKSQFTTLYEAQQSCLETFLQAFIHIEEAVNDKLSDVELEPRLDLALDAADKMLEATEAFLAYIKRDKKQK